MTTIPIIGEGIDPIPLAVRIERQRKQQIEDAIATLSEEVRHLKDLSDFKKKESADLYLQWVNLQQQSSDLILSIIHETAGTPVSCHVLRSVVSVLKRDEKRLISDLDRLASVHTEEDNNFHAKQKELEDAKLKDENLIMNSKEVTYQSSLKCSEHRIRVSELGGELQRAKDNFKDNIISHAQNLFCR